MQPRGKTQTPRVLHSQWQIRTNWICTVPTVTCRPHSGAMTYSANGHQTYSPFSQDVHHHYQPDRESWDPQKSPSTGRPPQMLCRNLLSTLVTDGATTYLDT